MSVLWRTQYNINSTYEVLTSSLISPQELFLRILYESSNWNLRPLHIYVIQTTPFQIHIVTFHHLFPFPYQRTQSFQRSSFKAKRGYFLHVCFQFTLLHHLTVSMDLKNSFSVIWERVWVLVKSLLSNKQTKNKQKTKNLALPMKNLPVGMEMKGNNR